MQTLVFKLGLIVDLIEQKFSKGEMVQQDAKMNASGEILEL